MNTDTHTRSLEKIFEDKNIEFENIEINEQKGGLFNHVLKVTNNKGFTLYVKQYLDQNTSSVFTPPKIPREVRSELAYSVQKKCYDLNVDIDTVPDVFFDKDSTTLFVEGVENPIVMIDLFSENRISIDHAELIAKTISRLHAEYSGEKYTSDTFFRNEEFRDFKLKIQYYNLAELFEDDIKKQIIQLVTNYEKQLITILHGDLNSRNIVINTSEKNRIGIIDFEQSHIGNPIYDISYFLCEVYISCLYYDKKDLLSDYTRSFLTTYMKFNPAFELKKYKSELKKHIAVQMLYRFFGPSKASWTFYVRDEDKKQEIIDYAKTILLKDQDTFIDKIDFQ